MVCNNICLFSVERVCSVHFEENSLKKTMQQEMLGYTPKRGYRSLCEDAVPTLFIFGEERLLAKKRKTNVEDKGNVIIKSFVLQYVQGTKYVFR